MLTHAIIMMDRDESNFKSYPSSESEFSVAENRLNEIEAEVMEQGKVIEKFIQNHSVSSNEPEHFLVLRELYQLFKTEVHLNIQLRKQISDSIPTHKNIIAKNQRFSEILTGFIRDFNLYFNQPCKNLNDITQFFLDHIDDSLETEKQIQTINISAKKSKEIKSKIEQFETAFNDCLKNIQSFKESASMKLIEQNSNIENSRMICSKLKAQIESEQQKKEKILHQNEIIKQKSSIYNKQIEYQRNDFDVLIKNFHEKQQKRKEKLQKLDENLGESKKKYNCLVHNVEELKKALAESQKEKSLIEAKAKEEISEAVQQRNVLNVLISELKEKRSQNLIIKEKLSQKKHEIENEIQLIEKKIAKIEYSITEWKAKLKAKNKIKQHVFDDIDNQTRILMKLREECHTDNIDFYLEMKQRENEVLLTENKKLESKLRITLKNIQNIQNENQDLKVKILLYNKENSNNNSITREET